MAVIFLNGCTSAGKTSIARALQEMLDPPHLRLGIDDAFAMLPRKLHHHPDGFFFDKDDRGYVRLNHGPIGLATLKAHARTVAGLARSGIGVIADEVVLDEALRADWAAALRGVEVFYVGVHCALQELERREISRGDRIIGQARGQIDLVHLGMRYALDIDSTNSSPEMLARQICDALT